MRPIYLPALVVLLAACTGTPEIPPDLEAVRDYVEVGELEQTDRIRTHGSDSWSPLTDYYALYGSRDGWYLLEFARICRELTDYTRITPLRHAAWLPDRQYLPADRGPEAGGRGAREFVRRPKLNRCRPVYPVAAPVR